jgi:hypothetical protein
LIADRAARAEQHGGAGLASVHQRVDEQDDCHQVREAHERAGATAPDRSHQVSFIR